MTTAVAETNLDVTEYYGEKEMRWYQIAARNETIHHIVAGVRRILVCQPTGTGKTVTIAATLDHPDLRAALKVEGDRPLRVLMVAHIHRLLTQAERTFADGNHVELQVTTPFANIDPNVIEWADIIIIDEAHHEAMMSVQYHLDLMASKPIVGLTATPDRADGMMIKFEEIVNPISREQAVAEGYLAETSLWSFVDTSGRNKTQILKSLAAQYHTIMGGTICFVATKKEARELNEFVNSLGLRSIALVDQTKNELNTILDAFSRGEVDWIINCSRIGEGVDVVGCRTVIIGRQLNSYPMLNQWIGRASRPDSECFVFELINPLSGNNLDTTVVVGTPKRHMLCSPTRAGGFTEREFDYTGYHTGMTSGVKPEFERFS